METELTLRSSITHLCDEKLQEPVIGQSLQTDELAFGYFSKHITKILRDTNLRLGRAKGENLVIKKYMEEGDLIAFSTFYARKPISFMRTMVFGAVTLSSLTEPLTVPRLSA